MLEYHLIENPMTPDPGDAMAQIVNLRSYNEEEIADLMLKRGTLLTKAEILAVFEVNRRVVIDLVEHGAAVNTPLYNIEPSMPGVYKGVSDSFDSSRHKVRVNMNPGLLLREAAKRIKTKKVTIADPTPYIAEVKDVISGSNNDILTPGGVVQLRGGRLRFIDASESNGVYLCHESGNQIKLTVIVENKPARIIAMLPADMPAGTYSLEVRTTYSHGNPETKHLKTGRFNKPLTV
jgi:hypothetical protein